MPAEHGWIIVLIATTSLAEVLGLAFIAYLTWSGQRELARMTRAVAGLVMQEEEKTRAMIGGR